VPHELDKSSGFLLWATRLLREIIARATPDLPVANSSRSTRAWGTTLVVTLLCNNQITVAHIGDSRCYRFRGDKLQQITRDHSLLQEQIDSGLAHQGGRQALAEQEPGDEGVGIEPEVEAEIRTYPAQTGDIYLLCSDELNDMVEDRGHRDDAGGDRQQPPRSRPINWYRMANDNAGAIMSRGAGSG